VAVDRDASGRTYLWDAKTAAPVHVLRPPDGSVADCSVFSFGGGVLAPRSVRVTGNRDGRAVHRWDAATGTPLGTVSDPDGAGVRSLAINVMGTQLAVADQNGTTYVWNLPS
jgi:WD40 repeat protein